MTQIVLTPEQLGILQAADASVAVCRPDGSIAGFVDKNTRLVVPKKIPFTAEEIAAAERDSDSCTTFYTTAEVLARLKAIP